MLLLFCGYIAVTGKNMAGKAPNLTPGDIAKAQPTERPYRLSDGKVPGLAIRIQPSGVKLYELRYGPRKSSTYVVGRWPGLTLESARAEAIRKLVEIQEHGAPVAIRNKRETAARAEGTLIVTLADLIKHRLEAHLTTHQKSGAASVNRLRSVFADLLDKPMVDITAWEVEKHRAARRKAGVTVGTTNRDLAALKSALARAVEWDIIPAHPLMKVKPKSEQHTGVVRFLGSIESDPTEEKRLRDALAKRDKEAIEGRQRTLAGGRAQHADLKAIPDDGFADHLTPLVLVAMNTGLRRGELTSLTWADVDLKRKLVTVRAGYAKSGKARHVPLNSEAVDVLTRWQKQQPEGRLFEIASIKTAWATLLTEAKITDFRFHDLRHHFASRLVQAGVDLNTVRELLGHADLKMTLRYAHLAPSNKADAVEQLVSSTSSG